MLLYDVFMKYFFKERFFILFTNVLKSGELYFAVWNRYYILIKSEVWHLTLCMMCYFRQLFGGKNSSIDISRLDEAQQINKRFHHFRLIKMKNYITFGDEILIFIGIFYRDLTLNFLQ